MITEWTVEPVERLPDPDTPGRCASSVYRDVICQFLETGNQIARVTGRPLEAKQLASRYQSLKRAARLLEAPVIVARRGSSLYLVRVASEE